jgi:response regulator of citrate/malate metabolism
MTGWNREIQSSEMLSRGLTDILKKPFTFEDVYKVIEKFEYKRKSGANTIA